jgi:ribosomal protein L14
LVKKKIYYGLIISTKIPLYRKDGIIVKSDFNRMVLLSSENLQFLGTRIYGPIYKEIVNITDKKKKKTQKYAKVVSYAGGII